jgi:putative ABC transport system permease protein
MDHTFIEFRDTARALRHDPLYVLAVLATLALTLGASTAIFSIVNGVLLRPLPYPEDARLVSIREIQPAIVAQYPTLPVNARHFDEWRNRATSFDSLATIQWRTTNLTGAGEPAQVAIVRASGTIFDVLRMPVALGRPLMRADERPDHAPVVVISHQLWVDRLGSDPNVLGRPLTLGGVQYAIVGVLQSGTQLPTFDTLGEAATLSAAFDAVVPFRLNLANIGWVGQHNYAALGRLKPNASVEGARAELNVIQADIAEIGARETHERWDLRASIVPLEESIVGRARLGILLLLGAIGAVVLIACANLANLSLARALARMRDAAVRTALGATRARLVARIVLEQLILAAIGGALGLLVAREGLRLFVRTAPIDLPRVNDVAIDGRVLLFAAAVSILAAALVALVPAWRMGRGDVQAALRGGGHGTTDVGSLKVRSTLVAVQVALSVTLLVMTGLFISSFVALMRVNPGFSADRVIAVEIAPVASRYPDEKARAALYDRIFAAAKDLPGITSAAWVSALPLTGETWVDALAAVNDSRPVAEKPSANYRFIGPDYFRTLSIPITKGRSIEERDRSRSIVAAVISARAAETLWPGENPLGRQFVRGDPADRFEVVGVVVDGHPTALETESPLMVYVPYWYNNEGKSVLLVHTAGAEGSVASELRRVIHSVDPEIAIADVSPLGRVVDKALEGRRYQMWLFSAFGVVALAIATVGVYATTAYGVSRRRREMNIRVALGAPSSQVLMLVMRHSLTPVFAGVSAGAIGALAAGRIAAHLLFKVRSSDPLVIGSVLAVMSAVGLVATAAAARQGLRLNPVEALRDE